MRVDRWVLPPAIAAAVFTTVAIAPPGGPVARGLRVETAGAPDVNRPLLVRLAVEDAGTRHWHAPRQARLRLRNAAGRTTSVQQESTARRVPYLFATITPDFPGPYVLEASAEGFAASAPVGAAAIETEVRGGPSSQPAGPSGIEAIVEGGTLVPEVPGIVLVRVRGLGSGAVTATSVDDALHFGSRRETLDACGATAFLATVRGLDAHAEFAVSAESERVARRRLPVTPGGLAVRAENRSLEITTAIGGQPVFLVAGDASGPTWWGAAMLADQPDGNSSLRMPLPEHAQWATASLSPAFETRASLWVATPPYATCLDGPFGSRFERAITPVPEPPQTVLAYDGAAIASRARMARKERARRYALGLAGLSIAMLIGMILSAGLRSDAPALSEVSTPRRTRVLFAIAGAGALLIGALVLMTAFLIKM